MIPVVLSGGFGPNAVKETLNRIGLPNRHRKTISVTASLVELETGYHIAHFKELLGVPLSMEDMQRLETIGYLLEDWKMVDSLVPLKRHKVHVHVGKRGDGWKSRHFVTS